MTSRAARDITMPMPIRQSNPSGLTNGSIRRPIVPATLLAIGHLPPREGQVREDPQHDRDAEDHRAGAAEKDLRAVVHPKADLPKGGPPVGRHFEKERRPVALQDGRLQEPRRAEGREEAEEVEACLL